MFSRTACFIAASVFAAMGPAAAQVRPQGAPERAPRFATLPVAKRHGNALVMPKPAVILTLRAPAMALIVASVTNFARRIEGRL
jgi:hypothetical protein